MKFRTANAIADCIRGFLDGTCGPYDWDDFVSVPLKDVQLEAIRRDANRISLPADADGTTKLHQLLERATALAQNSNSATTNFPMSSSTNSQSIDLAHLAQYTGGDPRLDAELLQMFAQQCTEAIGLFRDLCEAPDRKAWSEAAHALKGAAAGIGAGGVADLAARMEAVDPTSQVAEAADCLLQLQSQCAVAKAFIDAYLKQ